MRKGSQRSGSRQILAGFLQVVSSIEVTNGRRLALFVVLQARCHTRQYSRATCSPGHARSRRTWQRSTVGVQEPAQCRHWSATYSRSDSMRRWIANFLLRSQPCVEGESTSTTRMGVVKTACLALNWRSQVTNTSGYRTASPHLNPHTFAEGLAGCVVRGLPRWRMSLTTIRPCPRLAPASAITSPRQNSLRPACVSFHASYSSSDRPCSGRPVSVVLVVIVKPWRLCRRVPPMRIAGCLVRVRSRQRCAAKAASDLSRLFDGGRGRLCRHAAPPHFHNHPARIKLSAGMPNCVCSRRTMAAAIPRRPCYFAASFSS